VIPIRAFLASTAVLLAVGACAAPSAGREDTSSRQTGHRGVLLHDGEKLVPPPPGTHPQLTAVQAWRRYAEVNQATKARSHPPSSTRVELAIFQTSGDDNGRLVYGYRLPGCQLVFTGPVAPTPLPTHCTQWLILDANTAEDLDTAWQLNPS
jgi:hypothetical protein